VCRKYGKLVAHFIQLFFGLAGVRIYNKYSHYSSLVSVFHNMYILQPSHLEELLLGEPDVVLLLVKLELKAELVPTLGEDLPAGHHSLSAQSLGS
jgi:hypothetical protein